MLVAQMKEEVVEYVTICDMYHRVKTKHLRTHMTISAMESPRMEMGRRWYGLHH